MYNHNPALMRLLQDGVELDLSTKERDVLGLLMKNRGRVLARERLLNAVWGLEADPLTNLVDVTISRIRRKLNRGGDVIATVRNYGYRLDA
jgi:two-component system OmpR family response regulator